MHGAAPAGGRRRSGGRGGPARATSEPSPELVDATPATAILLAKERVDPLRGRAGVPRRGGGGAVVGCGALHVMWEDLAEVRTLAVDPAWRGAGSDQAILAELLGQAREVGVRRLFCLTFEVGFFERHGFRQIDGAPVPPEVYAELLRSMDEGVAEFLDLARVKPNTLGNSRMLRVLDDDDQP